MNNIHDHYYQLRRLHNTPPGQPVTRHVRNQIAATLHELGHTYTDIAAVLGIHRTTVMRNWHNRTPEQWTQIDQHLDRITK